jgi:hypothetical protein
MESSSLLTWLIYFPLFMESERSFLCSQKSTILHYPEVIESSLHPTPSHSNPLTSILTSFLRLCLPIGQLPPVLPPFCFQPSFIKQAHAISMLTVLLSVCLYHLLILNVWTNLYETIYIYIYIHIMAPWTHLNEVLHKSLTSVCVSVCVSLLPFLGGIMYPSFSC